ncbi:fibroblast growth factor 1-like isoform X2 [Actinia tenebrosa]|uniref:Fibroblast growth factor n=1 Tax=Actinia tenebrosa TaxID=6105 RepID=A0A6P8JB35_ACTTE|nr:fibroblast growth factor 1-like isoform X2 [Actinia tenebrosa]
MGVVSLEALLFILVAIFAWNCHARPSTRGRGNIEDLIRRPNSFEEELLDSIVFRDRPKRQAIRTTVRINARLQSKYGWFLAIKDDGSVKGTTYNSPNAVLRLEVVGKSLLRIYGIKVKKYLAMDAKGRLYSTSQLNNDTLFNQYQGPLGFNTFSSATHLSKSQKKMYVALRDNGETKKGSRTKGTHKSAQFTVVRLTK